MTIACRSPECAVNSPSSSEALDAGCAGTRLDAPTSAAFRSVVTLLVSPLIFFRDSRRQGSFCVWFTLVLNLNSSRNTPLIQPQHPYPIPNSHHSLKRPPNRILQKTHSDQKISLDYFRFFSYIFGVPF